MAIEPDETKYVCSSCGRRVTAASVITKILLGKKVPTDDIIIDMVRQASGSKTFGRDKLAWYKTQVRQGKLFGQNGKPHVIDQEQAKTYPDYGD